MTAAKTVIQEDFLQFNFFVPSCPVSRFSTILTISSVNLFFFLQFKGLESHRDKLTNCAFLCFSVLVYTK